MCINNFHIGIENIAEVFTADAAFPVFFWEGGDARMIGMCRNISVGNADGHPNGAFVFIERFAGFGVCLQIGSFANQFHNPHFVGIADGKRFAGAGIPVLFHQFGNYFNGFAGGFGTLRCQKHQSCIIHQACCIDQFAAPAKCRFTYGNLMFVHKSHRLVSIRNLRDLPKRFGGTAVVYGDHASLGPVSGRTEIEFTVTDVGIGGIGNHGGTVCRSASGYQEIGACVCR